MKHRLLPFAILIGVIVIFFHPVILFQEIPLPSDALANLYHPFRDFFMDQYSRGMPYKNFLITDPVLQQYPWRELGISLIKNLQIPSWNPYSGAGEPLLANIQSAVAYPLNILFLLFPFAFAWSLSVMAQMILGAIFLFLYLKNNRLHTIASIFGSLVFVFSGFFVAWLEWNTLLHVLIWLPLILLAIDKIFNRIIKKELRINDKVILKWSGIFIGAMVCSFLAGHLQVFFYVFIFTVVYYLSRLILSEKKRSLMVLFMILNSLFIILASFQLIPTLVLIGQSARDTEQQYWMNNEGWFVPPAQLIQFLAPDFFGNPATQNYWGVWNYAEMIGYIGILPVVLVIVTLLFFRTKKVMFFGIVLIISLLIIIPWYGSRFPFTHQIPLLSTSQPTRLLGIIDLCIAILSAYGMHYILHNRKRVLAAAGVAAIPLIVLCGIFLWIYTNFPTITDSTDLINYSTTKRNLYLPILVTTGLIAGFIFARIMQKKKRVYMLIMICLMLVSIIDLWRFAYKFLPFTQANILYPQTKAITYLQQQTRDYPWRVTGVDYLSNQKRIFPPNLSVHYKLYSPDTYNPLLLERYQEFAVGLEWNLNNEPISLNRTVILNNYSSPLMDLLGVKYIATIIPVQDPTLKKVYQEGEVNIYENSEAFQRAFMIYDVKIANTDREALGFLLDKKNDLSTVAVVEEEIPGFVSHKNVKNTVSLNHYSADEISIDVQTKESGFLVLSDIFYPTWRVYIDDQESTIYRTNYTFRGVQISKGSHTVVFKNNLFGL